MAIKNARTPYVIATEAINLFCNAQVTYGTQYKRLYIQALDAIYDMGDQDNTYTGYTYTDRYATGINVALYAIKTYHDEHDIETGDQIKYSAIGTDAAKTEILQIAKDHVSGAKSFVARQRKEYDRVQFTDKRDVVRKTYVDIHHLHRPKKGN